VQAYLYEGYWEDIGTIGAFFNSQLALNSDNPEFTFYDKRAPIYTMSRFLPPSKLNVRAPRRCAAGLLNTPRSRSCPLCAVATHVPAPFCAPI
jgi:hypothetical protein